MSEKAGGKDTNEDVRADPFHIKEGAEAISDGVQTAEAAWPVLLKAAHIIKALAGPRLGVELFDKFASLSKTDAFKAIARFKPYQVARIVLALGCASGPGDITQENLISVLNSVHSASRVESIQRSKELAPVNFEKKEKAVQHFLDDVRPHVETLRAQFGATDDPIAQRALRFAFSNVFISYENRISVGQFEEDEEYQTKMPEMLGAPIGLDDLLTGTQDETLVFGQKVRLDDLNEDQTPKSMPIRENPVRTEAYVAFKKKLFEIYNTDAFKALQQRVGDKGLLFDYEVLIDPDLAPPELVAEARERAKLSPMIAFVNPKTVKET